MTKKERKLLIQIIVTVLIIAVSVLPHKFVNHTVSPNSQENVNAFTGKNFETFQKETNYELTVHKVIDGDTLVAEYNGVEFKIRLLLVDAPETGKGNRIAQPYANEAKKALESIIQKAKKVEGRFDKGDYTDRYGRALMYVTVDGETVQEKLLKKSLVRVAYAYKPNISLLESFKEIEENVKKQRKNIWEIDGYVTDKGYRPDVY